MQKHLLLVWVAFFGLAYLLGNLLFLWEIQDIPELALQKRVFPEQGLIVSKTEKAASAAGIERGSRILSINGSPTVEHQYYFIRAHRFAQPGEAAVLRVQDGKDEREVRSTWQKALGRGPRRKLTSHVFFFELLFPLALILIGLTLNFSTAEEPAKRWASLMILSQILWFPGEPKWLWSTALREMGYLFNAIYGPLFFVFALGFFTVFPVPLRSEKNAPWLKWVILTTLIGLGAVSALHSLSSIYHFQLYSLTSRYIEGVKNAIQILWFLCLILICLSHARLPKTITAYQRRRMRLIWVGIYAGFLPPALLLFLGQFLDSQQGIFVFPVWLQMLGFLFFLAFPISVAISVIGWRQESSSQISQGNGGP